MYGAKKPALTSRLRVARQSSVFVNCVVIGHSFLFWQTELFIARQLKNPPGLLRWVQAGCLIQ
jgi:hypothetical protein